MFRSGLAAILMVLLMGGGAASNPHPDWFLGQNTPEPFCNDEGGQGTWISFAVGYSDCRVLLEVWSPDTTSVVRTLVDGIAAPEYHQAFWDGLDDYGARVPAGAYPYRMSGFFGEELLFQDTKVAHATCELPIRDATWGTVKAIYR